MGLDHELSIGTGLRPLEALDLLISRFGLSRLTPERVVGPGLQITALMPDWDWQELIAEAFHFKPTLVVLFRLFPSDTGFDEGIRLVVRATQYLLEQQPGDAVLLLAAEKIILQRLQGRLILNEQYGNWRDGYHLGKEINMEHEFRSLPSPLL